jgi:hypothetical protein
MLVENISINQVALGRLEMIQRSVIVDQIAPCTCPYDRQIAVSGLSYVRRPVVVRLGMQRYLCLENMIFVEQAKRRLDSEIECYLINLPGLKEEEEQSWMNTDRILSILELHNAQAACTYVAVCSKVKYALKKLDASGFQSYGHGGNRSVTMENDIIGVLADRLGVNRKTILKYRQHSTYVSQATMMLLVSRRAPKKWFEKIQSLKQNLVELLLRRGYETSKIERIVGLLVQAILFGQHSTCRFMMHYFNVVDHLGERCDAANGSADSSDSTDIEKNHEIQNKYNEIYQVIAQMVCDVPTETKKAIEHALVGIDTNLVGKVDEVEIVTPLIREGNNLNSCFMKMKFRV